MKTQSTCLASAFVSALMLLAVAPPTQALQATIAVTGGLSITCPPDLTVECAQSVPFPAQTVKEFLAQGGQVTNDCARRPSFSHVEDRQTGTCPIVITRTYKASTPNCGTATCEQIITVNDTQPPTITNLPEGQVQCGVPTKFVVTAEDNCDRLQYSAELQPGGVFGATLTDLGLGSFEIMLPDSGFVMIAFTVSDGCNKVTLLARFWAHCVVAAAAEGCSHGFWKNHTELWDDAGDTIAALAGFTTGTAFNTFFGLTAAESVLPDGATMLDALKAKGGTPDGSQLARDGVAALLNLGASLNYDLPDGIADADALESAITGAYQQQAFSPLSGQLGDANQAEGSFCE